MQCIFLRLLYCYCHSILLQKLETLNILVFPPPYSSHKVSSSLFSQIYIKSKISTSNKLLFLLVPDRDLEGTTTTIIMSDYDDDYMVEDEDYDLEYSEDSNSEPDVDLENQYYNSKSLKENNPNGALESFQRVLDLENGEKGEWGFKALKQMIKINFRLQNYEEMMTRYKQLHQVCCD